MKPQPQGRSEEGAVLLTVLVGLITILAVAALVIDLGAVRVNRAVSQTVSDTAATAGALEAYSNGGVAGCETALDYLDINLPGGNLVGGNCLGFPNNCDSGTAAATTTATSGNWVATLTYPVRDDSPLLSPSAIGNPSQSLHADDGDPCDRFGVSILSQHNYLFGRVLGATSQNSNIHAVARAYQPPGNDFALNLLILERYDCAAMQASGGGGGSGGIIVDAVLNTDTGNLDPGYIAVDSDGSGSCGPNGVIDVNGSNGMVRADGAAGCAGQLGSHLGAGGNVVGEGCGEIELLAPGVPGCNYPACTSAGIVAPDPSMRNERITRAPVDHRYNCKGAYPFPVGWGIDPCNDAPAPYIDNLVSAYGGVGTPAGFTSWTGAGYACNPGPTVVPRGNWHIDCNQFRVQDQVVFQGGNVVFDGDIALAGSGVLIMNGDPATTFPYSPDLTESIMYLRDGRISKAGGAGFAFHRTLLYMSSTSDVKMTGGAGIVIWSAPTTGNFDDLSLWAESTGSIDMAGGAGLSLEGVFFAPWATIGYQGSGTQVQVAAQFIARRLDVGGNGILVVRPDFGRAVLFPFDPQSQLIR